MIQFKHRRKVYYRDVDKMGIVYYSRYFEYFEEARTELLNYIGLSVSTIESYGFQLPVISSKCKYMHGAKLEQNLIIDTTITEIPKVKLKINYSVYETDTKQHLAKGYTVHAFVNEKNVPLRIPRKVLARIKLKFK